MSPQRYIFRRTIRWYSSPFHIFILLTLIIAGLFVNQGFRRNEIKPLFLPTPTPTRVAGSYAREAETHFAAGNLDAAIASYEQAISIDPDNGRLYAELARILTYSTESQTTDREKQERFEQAMAYADKAVELSPEDSTSLALRAFTMDWYASYIKWTLQDAEQAEKLLTEAEQIVQRAQTLDETNVLAQVFYAEIMIDQSRWDMAQSAIQRALAADPDLWDAHRVNAQFLENQAYYMESIEELKKAVELAPNMTFLYIKLGQAYRSRGNADYASEQRKQYYQLAIDYFAKAAELNEQLGIQDPLPYLGIGRAYAQIGEFFIASRNMNKALQLNPYSPAVYAQLGMVYRQARNYEDAITSLGCALEGCNAEISCELRQCNPDVDPPIEIEGMDLTNETVVYYYSYASLLAGMHLPRHPERSGYCPRALSMIRSIRSSPFADAPEIQSILNESESICSNSTSSSTSAQEGTATPEPLLTPTVTE